MVASARRDNSLLLTFPSFYVCKIFGVWPSQGGATVDGTRAALLEALPGPPFLCGPYLSHARRLSLMGFTAKAKLAAVLLDPKPPAAFLALSDGITVVPLALPLTSYVLHGAFHGPSASRDPHAAGTQ